MNQSAVKWLVNKLNDDFENNDFLISYANEIAQAKEIEKQQQDEFAIGFKDWCDNEGRFVIGTNTTKELLEIYKKEKGL